MLPASFFSALAAFGRLTVMPISLTNTAVMMKKISRFRTKSSIGARSMPVSSLVLADAAWSLRQLRMSVREPVGEPLGFAAARARRK